MSSLEKNQECFLHKGNDSKIVKFESVEYKELLNDGWVSDKAEAKRLFQAEVVRKATEEASKKEAEDELKKFKEIPPKQGYDVYEKIVNLEVIAINNLGDVMVRNEGDITNSDVWEIDSEVFNKTYKLIREPKIEDNTQNSNEVVGQENVKDSIINIVGEESVEEYNLSDMTVKELRALAKKLDICCVSKSNAKDIIEKINEKIGS